MTTKLYFMSGSSDVTNRPSNQQSGVSPSARWNATFSMMPMGRGKPNLGDNISTISSLASTSLQKALMQAGITASMAGAGTVGGGAISLYVAESESNTLANFLVNSINAYVWRPSTGTKVGTIRNNVTGSTGLGGTKPTAAGSTQTTYITGITSSPVNYQQGDCIIVELWALFTQSMATSYACDAHYGGASEVLSENAVLDVTGCASFIQFNEDVPFSNDQSPYPVNQLMMRGHGV